MRKYVLIGCAFVFTFFQSQSVLALNMEDLQTEIQSLKKRIRVLESQVTTVSEDHDAMSEKRQTAVSAGTGAFLGKELPTMRGWTIEIGGELEYEYVDTENDESVSAQAPSTPGGRFSLDKLVLTPKVHYGEHLALKADLEFTSESVKVDEVYVTLKKLATAPYLDYIKLGLDDVFNSPNTGWSRHVEDYPLIGTAFWQDEERMLEVGGDVGLTPFYWRLALANGRRLSTRSPNDDGSGGYPILHDDDDNADDNFDKEYRAGIGFQYDTKRLGSIDVLGWGADSELSANDLVTLQGITGYPSGSSSDSTNDENNEVGLMAKYNWQAFELQAQLIHAQDGELERSGWFVQPQYEIPIGAKYLESITPFFRYGELNVDDIPAVTTDSLTWDRQKLTFALIADIMKQVKVKVEYKINDEDTGGGDVNNNEFVAQLEMKF
jgi:hypothetical protein